MLEYLDQRNENPKPFVWTADADMILGKIERLSKRISRSGHWWSAASRMQIMRRNALTQ
jgi:hypothetical protein